jgi:hypothetical protein
MSPFRSIGHVLNSLTEIRPLLEQVQALSAMQQRYLEFVAPELAVRSRVTHEKEGTIYIQASTAAVAAKLRNLAPRILEGLKASWPNLTGIRVGTQPTPPAVPTPKRSPGLNDAAAERLRSLSIELPDGELKRALNRLGRGLRPSDR